MKPSHMMVRLRREMEAKYEALFQAKMRMLMQMSQDAAMIAAHDVLQMGPGRAKDFCVAYKEAVNDMARLVWDDQQDDSEFVYAKAKIDERIAAIVGQENFQPWEERYGEDGSGDRGKNVP